MSQSTPLGIAGFPVTLQSIFYFFSEVYNAHVDFRFLKSTWLFHMLLDDVWGWQRDI